MDPGCSEGPGGGNNDRLEVVPNFPLEESVSLWLSFAPRRSSSSAPGLLSVQPSPAQVKQEIKILII